jgi:hypothetical protein
MAGLRRSRQERLITACLRLGERSDPGCEGQHLAGKQAELVVPEREDSTHGEVLRLRPAHPPSNMLLPVKGVAIDGNPQDERPLEIVRTRVQVGEQPGMVEATRWVQPAGGRKPGPPVHGRWH